MKTADKDALYCIGHEFTRREVRWWGKLHVLCVRLKSTKANSDRRRKLRYFVHVVELKCAKLDIPGSFNHLIEGMALNLCNGCPRWW